MTNKVNFKALVIWLVVGGLIGWQLNTALANNTKITTLTGGNNQEENLDLDLFWDVFDTVESSYFDIAEVEEEDEVYGVISGLVEALGDPYSVFFNPEESDGFHASLDGELEGVGMELTVKEGRLIVVSPLKKTPAEAAGIQPGDHIYMVDGIPTGEMTLFDAIMAIRGEAGTKVELTILRDGESEPIVIEIIRAKIDVPTVETKFETVDGKNLAIVQVFQFGDSTSNEFDQAIRDVELQNADGIVFDMRLNGGGYLDVSIEVLAEFFEDKVKGVIVKRRDNNNEVIYTRGGGDLPTIPLVVLIDEGSASASEIVAGAIQDYGRGIIMGEQSFGKGSVQELASLRDGSSLRLTVAKWFTPDDRGIDEIGITPDIEIEMEYIDIDTENDIQMQAALKYLADL